MESFYKNLLQTAKIIFLALVLSFGIQYVSAVWTPPPSSTVAPANNASAPIHVGTEAQVKAGGLSVGSFLSNGGALFQTTVGVGLPSGVVWPSALGTAAKLGVNTTTTGKLFSIIDSASSYDLLSVFETPISIGGIGQAPIGHGLFRFG